MRSPAPPLLLALCLCPALALPLTTQPPEEDEKVTKCITEILADTLSRATPIPATKDCLEILKEDERVLAVLHHQHLLRELEEHHLGEGGSHAGWEGQEEEEEEVRKKKEMPSQSGEATSEKMEEQNVRRKEGEQEVEEHQRTEKTEEKGKEEHVSHGEENQEDLEEQVQELMDEEKKEEEEKEEAGRMEKRSSSETWSSKEYFGHIRRRDPGRPKIREAMFRGDQDGRKRSGLVKRRLGEEEDGSKEEPWKYRHGGHSQGRHHEDWKEDEEEEEEEEERPELAKRVAEKTSDEETAQFEEEEKGLKMSSAQTHLHGSWKPWEEEEGGERRHGQRPKPMGLDLKKRYQKGASYLQDRPRSREENEEDGGTDPKEVLELEKLEEIEGELKRAVEKLEELKRG
ncbi:hypothetical protein JRQ81_011417 [Phrynocephalus forsythii]|uniref:Chromogranin A n=1 Tax=Phrynocephalus forsythii TaxID=171643 RepID=A0A9Q0X7U5_9SAUR|nr:hypothetical protein JRQ81_011417 [Phrynocephalus forsythii]